MEKQDSEAMSMSRGNIKFIQEFNTHFFADSVEWCPLDEFQELLLCGTYQLDESKDKKTSDDGEFQIRVGRLHVLKLNNSEECPQLFTQLCLDMPGILDIKWGQTLVDGTPLFALVNAAGKLNLYKVTDHGCSVEEIMSVKLGEKCLGLSLDWSNRVHAGNEPMIVCSDSAGRLSTSCLKTTGLELVSQWPAHGFEAWIAAFDCFNKNIIYSGGDDCKLKAWDLRNDPCRPVLTSSRHSMGVCSLQTSPCVENLLCSGSYDENVMIWDMRQMKRPLAETGIGGGVWRVKWEPKNGNRILTASMHNGAHILDAKNIQDGSSAVLGHYCGHGSMVYGADWCSVNKTDNKDATHQEMITTCSFYDHNLHVWKWEDKSEINAVT